MEEVSCTPFQPARPCAEASSSDYHQFCAGFEFKFWRQPPHVLAGLLLLLIHSITRRMDEGLAPISSEQGFPSLAAGESAVSCIDREEGEAMEVDYYEPSTPEQSAEQGTDERIEGGEPAEHQQNIDEGTDEESVEASKLTESNTSREEEGVLEEGELEEGEIVEEGEIQEEEIAGDIFTEDCEEGDGRGGAHEKETSSKEEPEERQEEGDSEAYEIAGEEDEEQDEDEEAWVDNRGEQCDEKEEFKVEFNNSSLGSGGILRSLLSSFALVVPSPLPPLFSPLFI